MDHKRSPSDNPWILALSVISGCLAIVIFFTGIDSIPTLLDYLSSLTKSSLPTQLPSASFTNDCISSDIWLASSSTSHRETKDKCLDLSDSGIIASNGDLVINVQSEVPKISTIYMPLSETSIIKFNLRIDRFSSGENGNIAFGIGGESCTITNGEFIFYRSTDSKIYTVSGFSALEYGDTLSKYKLGSTDSLEFHRNNSTIEIYLNEIKVETGITSTNKPTFCISYRFPEYAHLNAVVSNFSIGK